MKLAVCVAGLGLLGVVGLWGVPPAAQGRRPHPTEGRKDALTAERPVEELRRALLERRSPAAQQVRTATSLLQRQPEEALRLAARLQQDPLFSPYGLQLEAERARALASERLTRGKPGEAEKAAARALLLFQRAAEGCAPPPAVRKLPEELGRTEALLGQSFHARRQWADAQRTYESAFAHFASLELLEGFRPETLGRYAESCARQVPPRRAGAPSPTVSQSCRDWLRRFVLLEGRSSPKAQTLAKHVPLATLGDLRPPARKPGPAPVPAPDTQAFTQALALYRAGKPAEAAAAFQALQEAWPGSSHVLRSRYWRTRALARSGKPKEARQLLEGLVEEVPLTYYGLLASMDLGEDLQARVARVSPKAAARDPALDACDRARLERAELFLAEGMAPLAAEELQGLALRESPPLGSPFLLYLAMLHSEAGDDATAFQAVSELLRRKHPGALTPFTLRLLFPPRHLELVQQHAAAHQLEPALVLGVMKQESSFRPDVVSDAGAVGLMQLLPSTAESLEKGVSKQLTQVEPNIRVGTKYLRHLLDYFCDNRALVLAGYNAGMGRVRSWRTQGLADGELVDFIEDIPLRETRDYVSQIIRNHAWYSALILGTKAQPLDHFWSRASAASPKTGRCTPKAPAIKRRVSTP